MNEVGGVYEYNKEEMVHEICHSKFLSFFSFTFYVFCYTAGSIISQES